MPYSTYGTYSKANLGYTDEEWEGLQAYLKSIQSALADSQKERPQSEHIEENPPQIAEEGFKPGGWIGEYPGDVTIVPGRLNSTEFDQMLTDIQGWVEMVGADTISAALPLSSDIILDKRARLAGYSQALIEYTESIFAHRLPVSVERTRQREESPQGRPVISDTIRERAQGSQQVTTEDVEFSFETLQNYLLVRFHVELINQMQGLADQFTYYEDAFQNQIRYHEQFTREGIPSRLVDDALGIDFSDPRILSKVRRTASGEMAEVVDLWEAFQRVISMELQLAENLTSAIKPMSKTYELWCLSVLDEILSDLVGVDREIHSSLSGVFEYGSSVTLYYNRSLGRHSNYLRQGMNINPGEPDFAIEYERDLLWVGDAKYKTWSTLRLSDYQRFITYLVDLLPTDHTGSILYIGGNSGPTKRAQTFSEFTIEHLALRPRTRDRCSEILQEMFADLL